MSVTTHLPFGFKNWSAPTYDEIHECCHHISNYINFNDKLKNVDLVVGVARGGLLPAVIISHMLAIPMATIFYSSKVGRGDNRDHLNILPEFKSKHLLIVDDLTDTGNTLKELTEAYTKREHTVTTAVMYYKELKTPMFVPDIWAVKVSKNFGWIDFPFENEKK